MLVWAAVNTLSPATDVWANNEIEQLEILPELKELATSRAVS